MTRTALVLTMLFTLIACVNEASELPVSETPPISKPGRLISDLDLKRCSKPLYCGQIGKVDCNSAADGPLYYFWKESGEIISTCGGACMVFPSDPAHSCRTQCPPPQWSCKGRDRLQLTR